MKFLPFLWQSLWRSKARTGFTLASIVVAFVLYALLQTVNAAFNRGPQVAGTQRLITSSLYTITESLPLAFRAQIEATPGVLEVSNSTWFGASFQEDKNRFALFAADHINHFRVIQELKLARDQQQAWENTRTGMVVGSGVAERFGFKVGDTVPIKSDIWMKTDGGYVWDLKVVGIYTPTDPENDTRNNSAYLRFDYFDEERVYQKGTTSLIVFNVAKGYSTARVAAAIDALSANSANESKTQTEAQFSQQFAKQLGDIGAIISGILGAVFFTLLILTGNTMMQSVRERIPELAVLKTLGFTDAQVMLLVLAEAFLLCGLGAALGVALGALATELLRDPLKEFFPVFVMPAETVVYALSAGLIIAVLVGLPPALRALRLSIVDALAGR